MVNEDHSDWVNMCPYLEIVPPNPNYSHKDEIIDKVIEIRDFFKEKYGENYMEAFTDYLSQLNVTPKSGTKLEQVLRSVKLRRLSDKILQEIRKL